MVTLAIRIRKKNSRVRFFCNWVDLPKIPKRGEVFFFSEKLILKANEMIHQSSCDRFAKDILSVSVVAGNSSCSLEEFLLSLRFMEISFPNKKKREYLNKKFSNIRLS